MMSMEREYWHVKVRDKNYFDEDSFRVIEFENGKIKATIGCKKGYWDGEKCKIGTEVQKVLFNRKYFTEKEAAEWVKKHKMVKVKRKRRK